MSERLHGLLLCCGLLIIAVGIVSPCPAAPSEQRPLVLVVMDPLAVPLSCSCVTGYAQRKYEKLAEHLQKRLDRKVQIAFSESLMNALQVRTAGRVDLIVGKDSVVRFDAALCKISVRPIARLTGTDGTTTQRGLIVVPANDRATTLFDLRGYKILFGPTESAEKNFAAIAALKKAGVPVPEKIETRSGCGEAAIEILEKQYKPGGAAVISSYAKPLLEGCGTIDPGSLRIVGKTDPVPFVTVFTAGRMEADLEAGLSEALLAVGNDPELCLALQTKNGFVTVASKEEEAPSDGPKSRGSGPVPPKNSVRIDP